VTTPTPDSWAKQNLAAIHARLEPIRKLKNGTIYTEPSGIHFHVVTKTGTNLRFWLIEQTNPNTGVIQSEIDLNDPLLLMEPYTQAMTLGLLWRPQPSAIYIAGFGGGRLPLILHHYLPGTRIDCTDIEPDIVNIAERFFGVKRDDRLQVEIEDGRQWLAETDTRYDLILLDVFLDNGYSPYRMSTVEFFQLCHSRLLPGGVVVINLLGGDPFAAAKARTLAEAFPCVYSFVDPGENIILFATDNNELEIETLHQRAAMLDAVHAFPYPFREHGQHLTEGLGILEGDAASAPLLTDATPPPEYFATLPSFAAPFSQVDPDLPCPCGSGLHFAACHGEHSSTRKAL
jgi:spermidine synthase